MKKFCPEETWLFTNDIVLHSKTLVHLELNSNKTLIGGDKCNSLYVPVQGNCHLPIVQHKKKKKHNKVIQ